MGFRCTRPRRSIVRVKLSAWVPMASLNARASSTMRRPCSIAPCPSVSMATALSLSRDDLAQQVPEGERSGEAHNRALLDELRSRVQGLVQGFAALLEHLLRVVGIEAAEDLRRAALPVGALRFRCHMGDPSVLWPNLRTG